MKKIFSFRKKADKQKEEIIEKLKVLDSMPSSLLQALATANQAKGYLIMITVSKDSELNHIFFTKKFPKGDLMPTLDKYAELLEREAPK